MRKAGVLFLVSVVLMCFFCTNAIAGGMAQFKVVDKNGKPISNIHILITDEGGGVVFEKRTNSYGVIQWTDSQIPEGTYILWINYGDMERNYGYEAVKIRDTLRTSPNWIFYKQTLARE